MADSYLLSIVTPEGEIFHEEVLSLMAPGSDGYFGVMAHHAPMLAALGRGVMKVRGQGETSWFAVEGGIVEVSPTGVVVLADLCSEADTEAEARELASASRLQHEPG